MRATVTIGSLHCYPLKSAAGLSLERALLTRAGIAEDRRWMIVRPDGCFLSQREVPGLARVQPGWAADGLLISAPGHAPLHVPRADPERRIAVRIWKHACPALDEGETAAAWFEALLGLPCRLVRFDARHRRLSSHAWTEGADAENRFSDGFPLLVIAKDSLADLNSRLERALPMARFRPNLVLEGLEPYQEDRIDRLYDAHVCLRLVKPCARCIITTTNQESGEREGQEPLRTLRTYRFDPVLRGVLFGQNAIVLRGAGCWLERGQRLQISWKAPPAGPGPADESNA